MKHFDEQTVTDLEFDVIRMMLHDFCISDSGRLKMVDLVPFPTEKKLLEELKRVKEFHIIRTEGFSFPRLEFEELNQEINQLRLSGSCLSPEGFLRVQRSSRLVNAILKFFEKNEDEFEFLPNLLDDAYYTPEIVEVISQVFDDKGKIRDNASPELESIRRQIDTVRRRINRNFNQVLKQYKAKGWLADTNEAFINDRKVLSVLSPFKRQVAGQVSGMSKTGNWTYIEPEINLPLNYELGQLRDDEAREIRRILTELTDILRVHLPLIKTYQRCLVDLDIINAKVKLALEIDADLPGLQKEPGMELIEAYHPLLLLNNRRENLPTLPQNLSMDKFSRMMVISGPNAGGKSITLKTVGLLQVMLQSGLLVPVNAASKMCMFGAILTDIGDHQSIENQLSTYSYRLKRMKFFLEVVNRRTLLLLDEFGTGSDPELGGALAEVFFEKLYSRKCFGIITTHYSNIKTKAATLQNAVNASMLFNEENLEPMYQLSIGQPGSSFTFEVAQSIGIDVEIVNLAKEKLDDKKVKLDKIIADLQKEKSKVERLNKDFQKAENKAKDAEAKFLSQQEKLSERLQKQQDVAEANDHLIRRGTKLEKFIKRYEPGKANKALLKEVRDYLSVEKTKLEEHTKKARLKEKTRKKRQVRKEKKANIARIKVGSTVRLAEGRSRGEVLEISDGMALVAFGFLKSRVKVDQLRFVKD